MSNRIFIYGNFVDRDELSKNVSSSARPSVAIEILREFSARELVGKVYAQTRSMNWEPVTGAGISLFNWYAKFREIERAQSKGPLYFQTPEKGSWEVLYFRQENDESGAYIAVALHHPTPYVIFTIPCSHCGTKQTVHVAARTGFAQMSDQMIVCVKCKKEFSVLVPDRILRGPFAIE